MDNTKALIRLELKARYGMRGVSLKTVISRYVLGGVFFAVIYALFLFGVDALIGMFHVYEMDYEFLLTYVFLFELIMLWLGISTRIRNLYYSGDNELLLRFPVTGRTMFVAKMVTQVVFEGAVTLLGLLPVLIMFGVEVNAGGLFWGMLPVVLLLAMLLPSAISGLLAIPMMYVSARVRHMHLTVLLVSIVLVAVGFAAYVRIFQGIIEFLRGENSTVMSRDGLAFLAGLQHAYPFSFLVDMMLGKRLAVALPVGILAPLVLTGANLLMTRKFYLRTVLKNVEAEGVSFSLKTKNRVTSPIAAIFRREFLDIFRSSNYSFQYLVMAAAAPVMVYSTNTLAAMLGSALMDAVVLPALTMLVMFIFVSITVSFAGSCISREGESFYLTKISPVPVRYQVLVKVLLYLMVAFLSILACTLVVILTGQVSVGLGLAIGGTALLFAVGLTCFAVKLDMTKPQFPIGGDGEVASGNLGTFVSMGLGLVLSVLLGVLALVRLVLGWNAPFLFGMIALFCGLLAVGAGAWLLVRIDHAYEQIVQR